VSKFDKWILFSIAIPVGLLFCYSLSHDFVPSQWWAKLSFCLSIILGALLTITVYRYQYRVWIPKNKIKKYSFKWILNIFLVYFGAPLMGTLASFCALSVGVGKVENQLFSEAETASIYQSTIYKSTNSRSWCNQYLEPKAYSSRMMNYKFCIENVKISPIVKSVNIRVSESVSNLGRRAESWELVDVEWKAEE